MYAAAFGHRLEKARRLDRIEVSRTSTKVLGNLLARNEGRDIWNEGPQILAEAARTCAPLRAALETWKDVTFDYASTDTVDYVATLTAA